MDEEHVRQVIKTLCETLVAEYAPAKIVLFGSFASGDATIDSDIDLLVIKETPDRFLDRSRSVRRILAEKHKHIPLDPIVLTPKEVNARLARGDQFLADIIENSETLYAA